MNSSPALLRSFGRCTLVAFFLLLATPGCMLVVAGAGAGAAVAYVRGDLDTTVSASVERATKAVNAAIGDLKYVKVSEAKDALQATVVARNSGDKRIEFRLERVTDGATKLKIRVGTFGDESLSLTILEKVKANL